MKNRAYSLKNRRRLLALSLCLFLFAIYLFTYRGGFHSIDEVSMFAVTESLAKFGQVNSDQIAWTQWTTSQAEAQGFFGRDGHVYSKKGLALSLAQVPLYGLALMLPGIGMLQTVSLLNAILTASSALLIFMFAQRLGFALSTAVYTALIFGLATIVFVYAKYLFSEPLAGFLLLLAAYMLFAYRQEGGVRHTVIAGLAAGFAILARANNLFLGPVFGLYLLWIENIQSGAVKLSEFKKPAVWRVGWPQLIFSAAVISFILALFVPGVMMLAYNAIRSGNPLQTGYDLTLFSSNPLLGLYKLLFSPLRGLFIYSPILILSIPGWWQFRKRYPAEAWFFMGLVGISLLLFSFWSSGEGLSWGSRFLVPLIPFFAICLAPIIEAITSPSLVGSPLLWKKLKGGFYVLLLLSLFIQILAVVINPWVFLARMQEEFGGEFFLEKTAALYDFRYSQIRGQLQSWSLENSDIVWWQAWGFDGLAFGLSLSLIILCAWLLWQNLAAERGLVSSEDSEARSSRPKIGGVRHPYKPNVAASEDTACSKLDLLRPSKQTQSGWVTIPTFVLPVVMIVTVVITYALLVRYKQTDLQFGPPDDSYTQTLYDIAAQTKPPTAIITVAQYHYHIPMNRFKSRLPLIGFAQQVALPKTALPLLAQASKAQNSWLVTIGFPPAAPNNATEEWLVYNAFKARDEWLPNEVRKVQFSTLQPNTTRSIKAKLGQEIELVEVNLLAQVYPGQSIPVEFMWQAITEPQADYNLFLQILNIEGALVAQHDNPPNGGYSPTTGWPLKSVISSRHALSLPSDLRPGDYRLVAGLYNSVSGGRLSLENGVDFVELGNITILGTESP